MDYNHRFSSMPAVSAEYKRQIYKEFGVQVTNQTKDPQPSFLFQVSQNRNSKKALEKEADKAVRFAHSYEEINAIYNDLGRIKNAMTEKGYKKGTLDIFKDVNAVTYGRNPHTAIRNWQRSINPGSKLIEFDIETLGDMDSGNIFTPTEISFYSANMQGDGLGKRALERSFIVSPNRNSVDNINELFKRLEGFYTNGKTPMLTDSERRTLGDLLKYSNGADFVHKGSMTELQKASNNYRQFVTGEGSIRRLDSAESGRKMLSLAREGLANLKKYGKDAGSVAQNISYYLSEQNASSNAFFMGHNIENFDNKALDIFMKSQGLENGFKPRNYIDTLDLANAFYPTPSTLAKSSAVDTSLLTRLNSGHLKMENLTKVMGFGDYTHSASRDTRQAFNVVEQLFYSKEGIDYINNNVLSHGGDFSKSFNVGTLRPGDELFATSGARDTGSGPLSFLTTNQNGKEVVDNSKFFIGSNTKYQFVGSYKNDNFVGVKLKNAMTGENVYVNKSSEKELRNFIYQKFQNAKNYTENAMTEMYENTRNDIARSRFRQMTNNVSYGNYKQLQSVLEAYNLEKAQGKSATGSQLDEIFSYNKNGSKVLMGNWKHNYRRMRGRLASDAPFLDRLVSEVERLHGGDASNPNYWPHEKRHMAVINAYQEAQKDFGRNTDIIELKGPKRYGMSLLGPDGKNNYISLADEGSARRGLRDLFNYTESTGRRNFQTADAFFIEVLDRVKDHASQYQKNMSNKDYELFTYRLDEIIRPVAKNQKNSFTQINELAKLLTDYKDVVPGFKKGFMEVEGLGARNAFTAQKMTENLNVYLEKGLKTANAMTVNRGFASGLSGGLDNSILKTVKTLDESLKRNYMAAGIGSEFLGNIPTMEDSLNNTIKRFGTAFSMTGDIDLGFELFNTGSIERPQITMAIFKEGSDSVKTLSSLKSSKNAALIDIPLINAEQYIQYGNQKKISPLALLYRTSFDKSGEIKAGTSFDYMMHQLNGNANSMIKAAQEGDFKRIEMIANGTVQDSLNYLSGSNKYLRDAEKMYSSSAEADFLKKNYILFRGAFERGDEQLTADGKTLYPSNKFNLFRDKKIHKMIKDNLGIDVSLESTRGAHAVNQFFLSAVENRNFVNFGMYNSPGRDNMIQMRNMRTLSSKAIDTIRGNIQRAKAGGYSGMSLNPLLITQSEQFLRQADNGFAKYPGVNVGIANLGELELIESLNRATSKEEFQKIFGAGPAGFPSSWENQALVSESFAKSMHSVNAYTKSYDLADIDDAFLNKVKRGINSSDSRYALDYMEKLGPMESFKRASRKDGVRHFITGFNINDGKIDFKIEEEFSTRAGVTKLFLASEKVTVRNIVPDDVMERAFGRGVHIAGTIDHAGHQGYGEVAEGLIKETINKINQSDLDRAHKKIALKEVDDLINRTFGLATSVDEDLRTGEFKLVINDNKAGFKHLMATEPGKDISLEKLGLENIDEAVARKVRKNGALSITELRTNLNNMNAFSPDLKGNILNLEARLARNSEDINFMSIGSFGKKGVKVGPRHVGVLMDKGYSEYARWIRDSILEESKQANRISSLPGSDGLLGSIKGQSRAFEILAKAARGEGAVPEGAYITDYLDVVEELKPLREGGAGLKPKGLYDADEFAGTIFDPDYRRRGKNGLFISLPEELDIEFGDETTGKTSVKFKNLYLADTTIEMSGKGKYSLDRLGRIESDIFNSLRDYNIATQHPSKLKQGIEAADAKERSVRKLKTGIKNYYNEIFHQSTSSHAQPYNRAMSARFRGSGRLNLQIMSPALELADEVNRRGGDEAAIKATAKRFGISEDILSRTYKSVSESGYRGLENSNTIFINRDRALDMLDGLQKTSQEAYDKAVETLDEGGAMPGFAFRSPVIHTESGVPVEYRIDKGLDYDTTRMPATLANAQFGDSDGDRISFVMAYDKKGVKYNAKKMQEEIARQSEELRYKAYNSKGSWFERTVRDFEKKAILAGDDFDYVESVFKTIDGELKNFDMRQMSEPEFDKYLKGLTDAKLTNATFTGTINNLTDEIKRIGRNYTTSEQEAVNFASGLGIITQETVSGKHGMTKNADSAIGAEELISWVRKGKFENFRGVIDKLSDEEIKAMGDVYGRMTDGQNPFDNYANQMFLSEKVARKTNVADFSMIRNNMVDSVEKDLADAVFGTGGGRREDYISRAVKNRSGSGFTVSGQAAKETAELTNRMISSLAADASNSKKFGPMAMAGMAIAGTMLGAGAVMSNQPLPMDYINNPSMNPTSGSGERQPMMDLNNIQNIVNNQGMDILINGQTTIDKDINELAGIVSQSVGSAMNIPVNININASDNRNSLSQQWIEERILSALE